MNILIWFFTIVTVLIVYWITFGYYKITISGKLVRSAVPFSLPSNDYTKTLLVLGDSTAVGVGADNASDSLPAKMASYLSATYVENHAVSGALVSDLTSQLQLLTKDHYDIVLLQIGANDIVRFHGIEMIEKELEPLLITLHKKASKVIFITAGNVGGAPLIPPPLRPFYTRLNLIYHTDFESLVKKHSITYINLYQDPTVDPFVRDPKKYFAADSFHPSTHGYAVWFEIMKKELGKE